MEFLVTQSRPETQRSACLILPVFAKSQLAPIAAQVDQAAGGALAAILQRGDMEGKPGQSLVLYQLPNVAAERVLLIGCGDERELDAARFREIVGKANAAVRALRGVTAVTNYLGTLTVNGRDLAWRLRQLVELTASSDYRFEQIKGKTDKEPRAWRETTVALPADADLAAAERVVNQARAIAIGMDLVRDLGNLPTNICTPSYLAAESQKLGVQYEMKTTVLEIADMEKLGMGSFLSVARGSRQPAKLIALEYKGGKKGEAPVALVGKGVTFDSGGISIKPAAAMDEMKYDMCGAASVLGTLKAIAEMQLPLNVVGVIPATENLPDGNASRPGDVVTSMSGQSIEILNTDAEGRLILCDALTYAERFNPAAVVDIATLTGACVIALGAHASGLLANDDALADELLAAGQYTYDRAWRMPLWDEYQKQLDSNFADMANVGGREAGTITAACFLARFTKKFKWAHLDIAGTAWKGGKEKGATGRPVPLLTQFLINRASRAAG